MIDALVDTSPKLRDPSKLTSCLMVASNRPFQILCTEAFNNSKTVVSAQQSQSVFDPVANVLEATIDLQSDQYDTWCQVYQAEVAAIVQNRFPTGLSLLDVSRALSNTALYTAKGRYSVRDLVLAVDRDQSIIIEWNGGFATMDPSTRYVSHASSFLS